MATIKIVTSDEKELIVDRKILMHSVTISNMLTDMEELADDVAVPLPNVTSEVMKAVVEWCEHHKEELKEGKEEEGKDVKPTPSDKREPISEWDSKFLGTETSHLFNLTLAANYLDIKPLLNLCCRTLADMIKGKSTQQIRDMIGIINDFTPEEEEEVRKENEWCEEN